MTLWSKLRWKYLLGVFKVRRIVNRWHGTRELDYPDIPIRIMTTTLREHETRARSVHKEPETVSWIEGMSTSDSVLYDIGANVGAYSLIAAARGISVVAFEPAPQNFSALHENITLNAFDEYILALPFVLGEGKASTDSFFIHEYARGATEGFFKGQQSNGIKKKLPVLSLDACKEIFGLPDPTAIKLDVDGGELDVLKGSSQILNSQTLKTLLVETEIKNKVELEGYLRKRGFLLSSSHPRSGDAENLIFFRG